MDGINKKLQKEVDLEVVIHNATLAARESREARRVEARKKIEALKDEKQLEDDFLNDYEDL